MSILPIQKHIRSLADPLRAKNSLWFFKTSKGDYGYGDKFLGFNVPTARKIAKQYLLSRGTLDSKSDFWKEVEVLICSPYHEERQIALFILVGKYEKGDLAEQTKVYKFYLKHTKWINNWDLVDTSAPKIVGHYLSQKSEGRSFRLDRRDVLYKLAKSKNLWERRIAIISTLYFIIKKKQFTETKALAEILLNDKHDLIHKAVGWMLREMGKMSVANLTAWLKKHYKKMPRTMLRYSIEKFPLEIRQAYLRGEI